MTVKNQLSLDADDVGGARGFQRLAGGQDQLAAGFGMTLGTMTRSHHVALLKTEVQ
jgi:hypothetical protein